MSLLCLRRSGTSSFVNQHRAFQLSKTQIFAQAQPPSQLRRPPAAVHGAGTRRGRPWEWTDIGGPLSPRGTQHFLSHIQDPPRSELKKCQGLRNCGQGPRCATESSHCAALAEQLGASYSTFLSFGLLFQNMRVGPTIAESFQPSILQPVPGMNKGSSGWRRMLRRGGREDPRSSSGRETLGSHFGFLGFSFLT